jgi:hypothetical protein
LEKLVPHQGQEIEDTIARSNESSADPLKKLAQVYLIAAFICIGLLFHLLFIQAAKVIRIE